MKKWMIPLLLGIIGVMLLIAGIYVGETDDAPGASGLGILSMVLFFWLSRKAAGRTHR